MTDSGLLLLEVDVVSTYMRKLNRGAIFTCSSDVVVMREGNQPRGMDRIP